MAKYTGVCHENNLSLEHSDVLIKFVTKKTKNEKTKKKKTKFL